MEFLYFSIVVKQSYSNIIVLQFLNMENKTISNAYTRHSNCLIIVRKAVKVGLSCDSCCLLSNTINTFISLNDVIAITLIYLHFITVVL